MADIYLSVIIPAYNEAERIIKTLKLISSYLQKQPYSWEVLVVNDGSKDDTANVVRNFALGIPGIQLIDRKENKGKGYTVRQGILAARGKVRLFTDADNSTDISYFEKMRPFFDKGYDIVISTRDSKDAEGAGQDISQSWYKRLLGNIGNLVIQLLAVPGIWDTQNGFKALRDYAAEKIFRAAKIDRWAFDVEALAIARRLEYKIGIIPIRWVNNPISRVKLIDYFKFFFWVAKIRWNINYNKYDL